MKRYRPLFSETHPYYVEKYIDSGVIRRSNLPNSNKKYMLKVSEVSSLNIIRLNDIG